MYSYSSCAKDLISVDVQVSKLKKNEEQNFRRTTVTFKLKTPVIGNKLEIDGDI